MQAFAPEVPVRCPATSASTFALATGRPIGVAHLPPRTYGVTVGLRF